MTRIKVCGITNPEDLGILLDNEVHAFGLNFWPESRRYIEPQSARSMTSKMPPFVMRVGLFVNMEAAVVSAIDRMVQLDMLQFHGDESVSYCEQFNRPYLKVARMAEGFDLLKFATMFAAAPHVRGLVLDTATPGFGGSGRTFDWSNISGRLPLPIVLAGGLTPDNVSQAIRQVRPWAVDVCSGVESTQSARCKDPRLLSEFVVAVRKTDRIIADEGNTDERTAYECK